MIYIITHSHYNSHYNLCNNKFIGVFSSKELVDSVIGYKSRNEKGFMDYPEGFKISKLNIDDDKNFIYKLGKTKLYLLQYLQPEMDDILNLGIYSSKELAKIKRDTLVDIGKHKKKQLYIQYVVLDLELWREGFISVGESLDSLQTMKEVTPERGDTISSVGKISGTSKST